MARKEFWGGPLKDQINIDELAKLFDLPPSDDVIESNIDYISDAYMSEGGENEKAEMEAQDEIYGKWHDAVEYAATQLLERHGLTLKENRRSPKRRTYEYRVIPMKSWEDAAGAIMETINGVGYFEFNSLREFLESGPYTAKQAVLSHLHWIKDRPKVYGDTSAQRYYDRSWR